VNNQPEPIDLLLESSSGPHEDGPVSWLIENAKVANVHHQHEAMGIKK
jgi:hypothetical protein